MDNAQRAFELLKTNDADGIRRLLGEDALIADARDPSGVSLLMHLIYRGRQDVAEAIASKKRELDIFEAASLGSASIRVAGEH